jgi:lysophospholipase L1-like esterase
MRGIARWVLRPFMRAWFLGREQGLKSIPRPRDTPAVTVSGEDSDRILIFGSGPAVGWGVLSHDLALPGALARALSRLTDRGTQIDVVADSHLTMQSAVARLASIELWRYDAIVVTVGINDAATLTSVSAWRRRVTALLDEVCNDAAISAHVFIVGIQPARTIPIYSGRPAAIADRHRRILNRETARICRERSMADYIPFSPAAGTSSTRYRTAEEYRNWAAIIADVMSVPLNAHRSTLEQ